MGVKEKFLRIDCLTTLLIYCGILVSTVVYCDIYCGIMGVLWYTVISTVVYWCTVACKVCEKWARISKKEAVAFCWISSECEESFLSSGSLMGSC